MVLRYLSEVTLSKGAATLVEPNDLDIQCDTGNSDDQFREIAFEPPLGATLLVGDVTALGDVGPDERLQLSVRVADRYDGASRSQEKVASPVGVGQAAHFEADVEGASRVVVRIACDSPRMSARVLAPRFT